MPMSKAFTRESDDLPERSALKRPVSSLPLGAKNYFTSEGLNNLLRELEELKSGPDTPSIRQRIFQIQQSLESAVAAPTPPPSLWDQVLFGASVTIRDQRGEEITYRIVCVDEADTDRDWISWLSPLAKALLKARVGDRVRFNAPGGEQNLEITAVRF
jgi:transcription elongation factor GreB